MSADEQAAILNPLRAVASAAGAVGRADGASILAGIQIDAPSRTVSVYLTDLAQENDFRAAMRRVEGAVDLGPLRFKQGLYTLTSLRAAADALAGSGSGSSVESVVVAPDGSSLRVPARDVGRAGQAMASLSKRVGSIPTIVEPVAADVTSLSRRRDTPSWISGEAITYSGTSQATIYDCTSGLPARRNSDGRNFLITAGHCYGDGATVYTGWENGGRNLIGTVVGRSNLYDAIAIDAGGGTTLSQEWDGPAEGAAGQRVYDVSGTAWSYSGDMACHDGYTTGIKCGLLVTSGYITWTDPQGIGHAGVEAHQVDGQLAGQGGDSGGLVFALISGSSRQARGIVSTRYNYEWLRWTEAPPILSTFGLSLAP